MSYAPSPKKYVFAVPIGEIIECCRRYQHRALELARGSQAALKRDYLAADAAREYNRLRNSFTGGRAAFLDQEMDRLREIESRSKKGEYVNLTWQDGLHQSEIYQCVDEFGNRYNTRNSIGGWVISKTYNSRKEFANWFNKHWAFTKREIAIQDAEISSHIYTQLLRKQIISSMVVELNEASVKRRMVLFNNFGQLLKMLQELRSVGFSALNLGCTINPKALDDDSMNDFYCGVYAPAVVEHDKHCGEGKRK